MIKLNEQEIQAQIKNLDIARYYNEKHIQREFLFKDFIETFFFTTAVALAA